MDVHYFSPGPASLPTEVRHQIQSDLLDTFGIGVSVMEISHRSKHYEQLNHETLALAKQVFQVPDTHSVLFSSVGAQPHFSLIIEHLSAKNDTICYTNTGNWAQLACNEAERSGRCVHIAYNGDSSEYRSLGSPKDWIIPSNTKYIHLTVNNTVCGTEYPKIPTFGEIPIVLDMTSALGSRIDIPWSQTGLIYASAQKNFGVAGVSVVIIRNDLLEQSVKLSQINKIPHALNYMVIFNAKSILNTPPVLPVFCMNRMLGWINKQGGLNTMEQWAQEKADAIYSIIDEGFYIGRSHTANRSRHNFVFCLPTAEQDAHFIDEAAKNNILEIKGYKSTGGIRASMYNGVSIQSAKYLANFMKDYRQKFG